MPVVIASINVQCLRTKLDLLSFFIEEVKPDVLCICEHWLTEAEGDYYRSIEYLDMVNAWYRTTKIHGGVCVYANKNLTVKEIDLTNFSTELDLEVTSLLLTNIDVIIISVYHSPDGNFENFITQMENCLSYLTRLTSKIALCGDFNIHIGEGSTEERVFTNLINSYGLFIANRLPTRGDACLDTVITNLNMWDYSINVVEPMIADHSALVMEIRMKSKSQLQPNTWHSNYTFSKRVIKEERLNDLKTALTGVNWQQKLAGMGASASFECLFQSLKAKFDELFPVILKKYPTGKSKGRDKPTTEKMWYTPELNKLKCIVIIFRDRMKAAKDLPSKDLLHSNYLRAKRIYRKEVEEAKKKYNDRFIKEAHNPCKAAWNLVNNCRKKPTSALNSCSPDTFNQYFVRIVEDTINGIPDSGLVATSQIRKISSSTIKNWKEVHPYDIIKIVKSYKHSESADIYGMSCSMLKKIIPELAQPLAIVINKCLSSGIFPEFLKLARTVPVYKKGDPCEVSSFRPISIIPILAKVVESVMKHQIQNYFENNKLFQDTQHGFRKGRSTVTAALDLTRKIRKGFEDRESVALTLCDLSKAFDCISHKILLNKLKCYGVEGVVLATLQSYMENRKQVVSVHGAMSQVQKLEYGVPQGSVIGPLLFLIYVNDMGCNNNMLQFADDTTLLGNGKTAAEALQATDVLFQNTKEWFIKNKMKMNEEKTQHLICTLSNVRCCDNMEAVKLLGFMIDSKLTMSEHTVYVCSKLSRVIYLLRRLKSVLTDKYLITVYYALFHSHISYGLLLWGHSAGCKDVLMLQKKAVRIITSSKRLEHCRPIFKQIGIMTIFSQYVFLCLISVKENQGVFSMRQNIHNHDTRNKRNIEIPNCRLTGTQDSFPMVALKMFNSLPQEVKSLPPGAFKKKIAQDLKERPLYSIGEFFNSDHSEWTK